MELIAYLDDNKDWEKKDIPANILTCINYAFANIEGLEIVRDLKKIMWINELKKDHPQLKCCISIGGWGADGFSQAVFDEKKRQKFIANILAYMEKYDFDGVDIDWEYPRMSVADIQSDPHDAIHFLAFVKEMRTKLEERSIQTEKKYLFTAAIGADQKLLDTMAVDGKFEYVDYLDYVNVMTYDMRGSFTKLAGHHTNLYSYKDGALSADQAVSYLLRKGLDPKKIVIGGAWYARKWTGFPENTKDALTSVAKTFGTQTLDYNELKMLVDENPEFVYWDETAQAPYYFDGSQFLSYDDLRSVKAKAAYIKAHHLRGFMYWEHSLDLSNTLVNAVWQVFEANESK